MINKDYIQLFLLGVSFAIPVNLIGTFVLGELVCLSFLIFKFNDFVSLLQQSKWVRRFTGLFIICLISVVFSTYYNYLGEEAIIKGTANYTFVFSSFISFILLFSKNPFLIAQFLFGLFIGKAFIPTHINTEISLLNAPFFEVYTMSLTPFILFLTFVLQNKLKLLYLIFLIYGFVCIYFGARSLGLIFLVIPLISVLLRSPIKVNTFNFIIGVVIAPAILLTGYTSFLKNTDSGKEYKNDLEDFSLSNPFQLMHRNETAVGFIAFTDKPLLGHGYDNPTTEYYRLGKKLGLMKEYGTEKNWIPSHSVIIGTAVVGGVFACLVFVKIFVFLFRKLLYILKEKCFYFYTPVILFTILSGFWGLWFSPLGFVRFNLPYLFAFIFVIDQLKSNYSASSQVEKAFNHRHLNSFE